MNDTVTLLAGEAHKRASKIWLPDGTTGDYDAGWQFQPHTVQVGDLEQLSGLLTQIEKLPQFFVIRGAFRGDEHATTVSRSDPATGQQMTAVTAPGWYRRWKDLYDDAPHCWMCVDIDNYTPPDGVDPVRDPVTAIYRFIEDHLPPEFDGAAFHWQLSSSAGHPTKAGLLKAHVWFWLDQPHTGAELEAWASNYPAVDRTLYRVVQVHYTALPVFAPGVADPVPVRSGYVPGGVVPLVLTPAMVSAAATMRAGREMIDPRTKTGLVGAFCRAYSIESLLAGTLSEKFSYQAGSDRRLTWHDGRGAVGGAYLSDDRLHLCNEHATSPVGNTPLNAFDAVRVYCFGHLDAGADPLAMVEMRTRPSYRAMCGWAAGLEPVIREMRAEPATPIGVVPEGTVVSSAAAGNTPLPVGAATATRIEQETLLFPEPQMAYFAGCVYVADLHRVMTPDGQFYDQQRFNALYGGRSFVMDNTNARTVRSAWEALLESQALQHTKVNGCMFRPEMPPGAILPLEGRTYVNMYVPIETRMVEGDPTPFLRLVGKMLPDLRDQKILLTYLASMLRNPGVKFQWWPVLQGAEGNGKTLFIRAMQHAVGHRYSHLPNTGEMAKNGIKFNAWIVGCLFLGFEEVYVPGRREFLEEMKPIVTNDSLQVERKGVDQTMEDNRANGIMCTNHKDGVPVTTDTRRYPIFYTAQQTAEDKVRDGMTGEYFRDFYDWCYGRGAYEAGGANYGYAIINWYLREVYELSPEFDPAHGCQVAPKTSSSEAAIRSSLGSVEQEILEAIEQGEQGFRGGWVSSKALDRLMDHTKGRIPRNKRRDVMRALGYDWHPALTDGRLGLVSIIDAGKPTLYVKMGSPGATLAVQQDILKAYLTAQGA